MKITVEFESLKEFCEFIKLQEAKRSEAKTSLWDAELLVITVNILRDAGFEFLEDVQSLSDNDLLKIPRLGRKSIQDIRGAKSNAQVTGAAASSPRPVD